MKSLFTARVALCLAVGVVSAQIASPVAALAQQRGAVQRIVTGKITDGSEKPVKNAVVYLKDTRTLTVKSYISAEDGTYRFGQLSGNTDYEVWAELNGKKSAVKSISSFDTKATFVINLKVG